ncbi:MAG: MATE family efflux transporter, partial [Polaromonas sp.]
LGTVASASHQIAASVAAVLYMLPLSLAVACSARVSFWLGAGRPDHAKSVVFMGLRLAALAGLVLSAIVSVAGKVIASGYSGNPAIVALASALLVWVALYHVADAFQVLCAFLLRCYGITMAPLALYGVLLWGLGLLGGYRLAYVGVAGHAASQSAGSFWAASTLAIGLVAAGLLGLLWRAMRRSQQEGAASIQSA